MVPIQRYRHLIGERKPISHYRDMLYNGNEKLYLAVKEPDNYYGKIKKGLWAVWPTWESWNWPGHEGKPIEVEAYSRYGTVRLYLNGKLIGEKAVGKDTEFKAVFTVPYSKGALKLVGVENGVVMETKVLETSGEPAKIRLTPEKSSISANGQDLCYVRVDILDKMNRICPNADLDIDLLLSGEGKLLAAGNANIKDTSSCTDKKLKVWKGKGLVIIRSTHNKGGFKLKTNSSILKNTSIKIACK